MEYLLSVWKDLAPVFKKQDDMLLLADYDGTLTPIVSTPGAAVFPERMCTLIDALRHRPGVVVGIISGRALADVKARVALDGIIYAGNHGLEIEGHGLHFVHPVAVDTRPAIKELGESLKRALKGIKGALVEDKGLTLSVHYRLVGENDIKHLDDIFKNVITDVSGKLLKITYGKKVYEVRPAIAWNKGKAIELIVGEFEKYGKKPYPVFLGDDVCDEDGFCVIEGMRNGISVFIGEPDTRSSAQFYLKSTEEVAVFFGKLLEARGGPK